MAGSTYSSNLKIELMSTGENSGTWGDITNTNLGTALEQAIVGYGNPNYVSDANLTISITNSNASQAARALVLNVTSSLSLTATRELVVPTIQKQYIVQNNTTGSQSITVKTSAGTGITVPNGRKAHLYVNGTDVIQMFDFVDINGGTIDGATVGASSASTGAFTTLTASGATTLNGAVTLGDAAGDNITFNGTVTSHLLFTDNTYDIGANGATRPRNLYLAGAATIGGNLSVGGTLTLTGGVNLNGNVTVGDSSSDTLTINSTITSNLIFTDNTYDIGASGATRPRNLFLAGNATIGGNQTLTGTLDVDNTTQSTSTTTGAVVVDGGVGIAKAMYVGGVITQYSNNSTAALRLQSVSPYAYPGDYTFVAGGQTTAGASIRDNTANVERLTFVTSETVFNQDSGDIDFRVESDGQQAMLFVDAGNNRIGFKTSSPASYLYANDAYDQFFTFYDGRTNTSGTFDSYLAWQTFGTTPLLMGLTHNDYANTNRRFFIKYAQDNVPTYQERMGIAFSETVFNENSNDVDFRVESDGNANMFIVDAGTNTVLIGTSTVNANGTLQVNGGIGIAGNSTVRQVGNGDGSSLKFFGTQFVAGQLNSASYGYAGGGLLASVAAGDSATLFDAGRQTSTDGRVQVVNTTSGNVQLRVGKNGSYALLADTNNNRVGINNGSPSTELDVTGNILLSSNLYVGGNATTSPVALNRAIYLNSTTNNDIIGVNMYVNDSANNRRGTMFLNDSTGVFGFDTTASSGIPTYVFYRVGSDVFHVGDDVVVNDIGADIDFRVESDANANAIFLNAQFSNVGINCDPSYYSTLYVQDGDQSASQTSVMVVQGTANDKVHTIIQGNGADQGTASWNTFTKLCPSVSSNNKLIIPFISQGNLNSNTVCRVIGHNAAYNTSAPQGFEITFAVGHLNALYSLASWGASGNATGAAVNGMNVEISFSSAYNVAYGVSGGVFITIEYMTNVIGYSIDVANIRLN